MYMKISPNTEQRHLLVSDDYDKAYKKFHADDSYLRVIQPFIKKTIDIKVDEINIKFIIWIFTDAWFKYELKRDNIISTQLYNFFYVFFFANIDRDINSYFYDEIISITNKNPQELQVSLICHILWYDMCYLWSVNWVAFLPFQDYLYNVYNSKITWMHSVFRFQNGMELPWLSSPISELINKFQDDNCISITVKKWKKKWNLSKSIVASDLEIPFDSLRYEEIWKKYPHSEVRVKYYKSKAHKFRIKEQKNFER